ncbi:MAG: hybrid sensor histidine kinase/response regulator [Marinobacter sp.]|nr:hybrid sensor histidine kinase/response regulator [Marinobacter sp.]
MNDHEIEQRITLAALEPYIERMGQAALLMLVVPSSVVVVLWTQINQVLLVVWWLLMAAFIGGRYLVSSAYQQSSVDVSQAGIWGQRMLFFSLSLGALWSVAILAFFVENSPPHQVFVITIAVTLGIGSISAGTHWLPLYYGYGVPILLSLVIRLLLVGTLPYMALAAMMMLALLASVVFARKLNSIVRSEMRLRHETAELARQLRLKSREAEEAVYAKSRVLAAASHDLRQPLHALSLFFDALKEPQPEQEQVRIFNRIDSSIESLRKLFDGLFDMSRLDANVVRPEISHFDIRECLEDLCEEYRKEAGKRGLQLKLRACSCVIESDRALLERILRNLISNALRYTDSGTVLIAARKRRRSVLIQVWDTGIGIPYDSQEKAFSEFGRLQSASGRREKGLGFGLAIVRRLCELMRYPLSMQSRVGRGTVLSFQVPKGNPARMPDRTSAAPPPSWHNPGHRILVIDDDSSILSAMNTLLSSWGFEVVVAENYDDALRRLKTGPENLDLILSDLSLNGPDNGIEVVRKLRTLCDRRIPAMLISGTTNPDHLNLAETSGLRLIHKPISPTRLRGVIQHQLLSVRV